MDDAEEAKGPAPELPAEQLDPLEDDRLWGVLTNAEKIVARQLAKGRTCAQIAKQLDISVKTADTHRGHVLKKLQCFNTTQLAHLALARGWVELNHHVTRPGREALERAFATEWPL